MNYNDFETLEQKLNLLKGKKQTRTEDLAKNNAEIAEMKKQADIWENTRMFLLELSKTQRKSVIADFAGMVTKALQFITQEDISFEIEIDESRGAAEVNFFLKIVRNGEVIRTDLEESHGDGYLDITALALSVIMYLKTNTNSPLIVDEPCKQLSESYREGAGQFLEEIADMFGIQILMITNLSTLSNYGNKKFRVALEGSKSVVTSIN